MYADAILTVFLQGVACVLQKLLILTLESVHVPLAKIVSRIYKRLGNTFWVKVVIKSAALAMQSVTLSSRP